MREEPKDLTRRDSIQSDTSDTSSTSGRKNSVTLKDVGKSLGRRAGMVSMSGRKSIAEPKLQNRRRNSTSQQQTLGRTYSGDDEQIRALEKKKEDFRKGKRVRKQKSYYHVPKPDPLIYETIPERLRKFAEKRPDKISTVVYHTMTDRRQLTRRELYDQAWTFARALRKHGVQHGDRVALCAHNFVNWLVYDIGIQISGGVSVHVVMGNFNMRNVLVNCSVLIVETDKFWKDVLANCDILPGGKIVSESFPYLKLAIAVSPDCRPANTLLTDEMMEEIEPLHPDDYTDFPIVDPEDTAFIKHTSGTSGAFKWAKHAHFNAVNSPHSDCDILNFTEDDARINGRHMAYTGGYPVGMFSVGWKNVTGDPQVLNKRGNLPLNIEIWQNESITNIVLAPLNLTDLRGYDVRIKTVGTGGDLLTHEQVHSALAFGDRVNIAYSGGELYRIASRIFTEKDIHEHVDGMLGRPCLGVELKVINHLGHVVDRGVPGVVCVRSPWMLRGYEGGQGKKRHNGWVQTDDVAIMLKTGDLVMKGRTTELVRKNDLNILTQLMEVYIDSHPEVYKVLFVNVPNEQGSEDVCGCVQTYLGKGVDFDSVREHCYKKMREKYSFSWMTMVPRYFVAFEAFPKLLNGKFDKVKIIEGAIEMLGLNFSANALMRLKQAQEEKYAIPVKSD
uniref:Acyl CoA synthetase n=1 Tax=Watasenia scintillans TaxID=6625 RepID=A0A2Z6AU09_WATSC|nr:acyl CoA synthetase [Watasenia scintillans]